MYCGPECMSVQCESRYFKIQSHNGLRPWDYFKWVKSDICCWIVNGLTLRNNGNKISFSPKWDTSWYQDPSVLNKVHTFNPLKYLGIYLILEKLSTYDQLFSSSCGEFFSGFFFLKIFSVHFFFELFFFRTFLFGKFFSAKFYFWNFVLGNFV